jgi:hypothetical protein
VRKLTVLNRKHGDLSRRYRFLLNRRTGMNNHRQSLQAQAVFAGVSFRQLVAAFGAAAAETLVRRDDAKLRAQKSRV